MRAPAKWFVNFRPHVLRTSRRSARRIGSVSVGGRLRGPDCSWDQPDSGRTGGQAAFRPCGDRRLRFALRRCPSGVGGGEPGTARSTVSVVVVDSFGDGWSRPLIVGRVHRGVGRRFVGASRGPGTEERRCIGGRNVHIPVDGRRDGIDVRKDRRRGSIDPAGSRRSSWQPRRGEPGVRGGVIVLRCGSCW